jgi:Replication initiator protein A
VRTQKGPSSVSVAVTPKRIEPKPPIEFVKIEKNLNTLGFFTPAKHRGAKSREKVVFFRRELNGKTIEAQATILPSAKYGLPTTADLDKYLAFHKLLENMRNRLGEISNPVGFTSTQLLTVLGIKDAGNNYQDIHEWLQRMTLTGINSKGVVYMARRKTWVSDTFHVFDRVVTMGSSLPDGTIAEKNYVWLSDWQLENINSNYLLPIDLETYRKLRNQIAKILVPLLQVWLYASRAEGRFEKRYPELCEILDIVCHKHLSLIRRQLEPSLMELAEHGYLAAWAIQPTADGREFKLVATHGEKFYRDQKIRSGAPGGQIEAAAVPLLKQLTERGINEVQAQRLLRSLPVDRPIQDQLEYGDYLVWKSRATIKNAPGFYVYLLRQNILPPEDFETSSRKQARQADQERQAEESRRRLALEDRYHEHCRAKVRAYLHNLDEANRRELLEDKLRSVRRQWGHLPPATIDELANRQLEAALREKLSLPTIDEFAARSPQESLFD